MKSITFVIKCSSYLEAATVEEWLTKEGISYEERINDGGQVIRESQSPAKPEKRIKRHRVTGSDFAHIRNLLKQHPNWSDRRIKEHYKLKHSTNTICNIRNGKYDQRFVSKHVSVVK